MLQREDADPLMSHQRKQNNNNNKKYLDTPSSSNYTFSSIISLYILSLYLSGGIDEGSDGSSANFSSFDGGKKGKYDDV